MALSDLLTLDAFRESLNNDPEFAIAARHWTVSLCLEADGDETIVRIREGEVVDINPEPTSLHEWDIVIRARSEVWRGMLRAQPQPFYQDFFPAMLYHGLEMRGDLQSLFAYYPAVRRMGDVMRSVANA